MNIQISDRLAGLKPYAFAEIQGEVEKLKAAGITPIDFGVGDPSEPTPAFVIEGLKAAGEKHATTGYPSYIGLKEFRTAAANYMKRRFNVELDPETEISSNIGSKEAIFNFPEAILNPGDVVIIPSPGYPPMKTGTVFAEGEPFFVPLLEKNGWMLDFEAIPLDVVQKAKIIWINYPNSPTGAMATRNYYEKLINWAHQHNIIIAADEGCYIDIYFGEKPMSILEIEREGIITFYSLSKRNNMTGYRAGFVAGDKRLVELFRKLKTNIDSGTPNIVQEVAMLALNDDEHVAHMRQIYREKGEILIEALKKIGLEVNMPAATFYIWQKVPTEMSDVDFAKKLLEPEIGIVVTPGSLISDECEGGINSGKGYVRFALMPTFSETKEAAERLTKCRFYFQA